MNSVARPRGWPRNSREADEATELVLAVELNVVYPSICPPRAPSCAECDPTLRAAARLSLAGLGLRIFVQRGFLRPRKRPAAPSGLRVPRPRARRRVRVALRSCRP